MKSKEEIEQLAENSSEVQEATYTTQHKITYKHGYIDGYTQCQEDMADEMENCMRFFLKHTQKQITDRIAKESPDDFDVAKEVVKFYINSLNKQD